MNLAVEAHLRLLTSLPIRTHVARESTTIPTKRNVKRPVRINGTDYPSVQAAVRGERMSAKTVILRVIQGRAKFLAPSPISPLGKPITLRKDSKA